VEAALAKQTALCDLVAKAAHVFISLSFSFTKTSITSPKENFTDNNVVTSLVALLQLHWKLCFHFTAFLASLLLLLHSFYYFTFFYFIWGAQL